MPLITDKDNATFIQDIHNAARDSELAAAAKEAEQSPEENNGKTVSDYLSDIQKTD